MYCLIWLAEDVVLLYDKCNEVYYINILIYNIEKKGLKSWFKEHPVCKVRTSATTPRITPYSKSIASREYSMALVR